MILLHLESRRGRDVDEHAARTGEIDFLEQGARNCALRGLPRAIGSAGGCRAHHRHADFRHHRTHVGEIDVDQPWIVDDFGDSGDGAVQHLVRGGVGVEYRYFLAEHLHQLVVRDDDQ